MANDPKPSPQPDPSADPNTDQSLDQAKDSSPAAQETVAPDNSGVQVGGLKYTENADGTRTYPDQKPVETVDDPTPLPETPTETSPDAPKATDAPVGK